MPARGTTDPGAHEVQTNARARRGPLALAAGAVAVVAVYLWDDLIFAAPVVATAGWIGPAAAFAVFAPLYALGSWVLAMVAVRSYERSAGDRPNRLASWLEAQRERQRGTWARRLLDSGKLVGFVISSFLIGGILTTWILRYSGRREGIARLAAWSSAIFGVTFVGLYSGVAAAAFALTSSG